MKSKKILIVSASIGNGHMQAASTVGEELQATDSCNVTIVDFLQAGQFRFPALNRLQIELMDLMKSSYYGILKVAPNLYKGLYRITENKQTRKIIDFINAANQKMMASLISEYRPHGIICTHPFPLGAASALRHKSGNHFTLAGIITDFTVHPWWITSDVDHYFVANQMMVNELKQYGIQRQHITATGIPVNRNFKPADRSIRIQAPQILVMGGGLGFGSMEATLRRLEQLPNHTHITVVAGKNEKLQKRLKILALELQNQITILPFSPHIAFLMKEADLLITKPGGLTCSEALAVNLPMILLNPLPGQEEENAAYLHWQGAAYWVKEENHIPIKVAAIFDKESTVLKEMQDKCREISPHHAGIKIAERINDLIGNSGKRYTGLESWRKAGV